MNVDKCLSVVTRDMRLISFVKNTSRAVKAVSTVLGVLVALLTVLDAVRMIKG